MIKVGPSIAKVFDELPWVPVLESNGFALELCNPFMVYQLDNCLVQEIFDGFGGKKFDVFCFVFRNFPFASRCIIAHC